MVFDLRLKKNFKIFLSGPSGCGKTTFISDLITNLDCISVDPPKKVIYFYKEWQAKFDVMEQSLGVNFIEDNDMIIEQIKNFNVPALVICHVYSTDVFVDQFFKNRRAVTMVGSGRRSRNLVARRIALGTPTGGNKLCNKY